MLSVNKQGEIKHIIESFYSQNLSNALLAQQSERICRIMDSHYFATILFSNRYSIDNFAFSNNPGDFNEVYFKLLDKDVLLHTMVRGNTPVLYDDVKDMELPGAREFFGELNPLRPVSDCCYYPMMLNGRICGFNGIARADENNNKTYDAEDLALFRHLSSLINESFIRSLFCEAPDEWEAVLDAEGHVLQAGSAIEEYLRLIFGDRYWNNPCSGESYISLLFTRHLREFINPLPMTGSGFLTLPVSDIPGILEFKRISTPGFRANYKELPQVLVSLVNYRSTEGEIKGNLDWQLLHKRYELSAGDADIIDCIYRGLSDSDICSLLRIDELSYGRRLNEIYTKTGVNSRGSLILSLI